MTFKKRYDLVLDLYPLLAEFPAEAWLLVSRTEQCAFEILTNNRNPKDLQLLLRMARDLGFLDERLYYFIEKRIEMI
jgi:hypothetical protein